MTTERIRFKIVGDSFSHIFDPSEYTDCENVEELASSLIDAATDQASWDIRLDGDRYERLWELVKEAKEKEEC